ncbi:MAG TPA: CvpA family protein [Allosphingosinicella sp.]|jgi:membrane protein required for colicin V production|nr:CvpA family protein [Allosphingosinicella sp.]
MALTALDIVVVLLVGAGLVFGFLRGFVAEILSLFAWVLAVMALRYFHAPVVELLRGPVGSGAWLLAFVIVFGLVFVLGKLASRRLGGRVRNSVVGPIDRILGAGFGVLKGLIGATLLYLALNFVFDMAWGRSAARPAWIADSRTYPLLQASGEAIVDLVEARRGPVPAQQQPQADGQNAQ